MSRYAPVKCRCAHAHRGACPRPGCGCLYYRPRAVVIVPVAPRVVRGAVVRELQRGAS